MGVFSWLQRLGGAPPEPFEYSGDLIGLAARLGMRQQLRRYEEADAAGDAGSCRAALDEFRRRCEQVFGAGHPNAAIVLERLGFHLLPEEGVGVADAAWARCLSIRELRLGTDHPDTLRARHFAGCLQPRCGRPAQAVRLLEGNLAALAAIGGPEFPWFDQMLSVLAISYRQTGDMAKAEAAWRRLLDRASRRYGPEHPDTALAASQLGNFLAHAGRYAEAAATLRESIEALERGVGPNDPRLAQVAHLASTVAAAAGDHTAAEVLYDRCVAICLWNGSIPPDLPRCMLPQRLQVSAAGESRGPGS